GDDELGELARALAAWQQEATNRLDLANAVTAEKELQARTLELLNRAATATSGVLESAQLGHILVEQVGELLGGAEAVLSWHNRSGTYEPWILAWTGLRPDAGDVPTPQGAPGRALPSREPLLVEDYQSWAGANKSG